MLAAIAWFAAVALIALGAAGIVAGMDSPPADGSRPELTAAGDAQVNASLDAIEGDIGTLTDEVDALGVQARGALAALVGSKLDTVDAAVANGDGLVTTIGAHSADIAARLAAVPLLDTPEGAYRVSNAVRERRDLPGGVAPGDERPAGGMARLTSARSPRRA